MPGEEYFADGISEDLVTSLARIRWLFVIARNSTFAYKRRTVDAEAGARASSACATSWKAACAAPAAGCASPRSWSMRRPAAITGPSATSDRWVTSSPCRTRSPRNVAAAIEPRLLAAEGIRALWPARRTHLGAWELVAQAQTALLADDACRSPGGDRAAGARRPLPIPTTRRRTAGWGSAWCSRPTWDGSVADQGLWPAATRMRRAIALDDCDPWGHRARLLGDDGAAHRESIAGVQRRP